MLISRIFTIAGIVGTALWLLIVDVWWFKLPIWRNEPDEPAQADTGLSAGTHRPEMAPMRPAPAGNPERARQEYGG